MRPETRPDKPYTTKEILDRVYQHFVVEGNPRCADDRGSCFYRKTGCAVGCLLTAEDAAEWDDRTFSSIGRVWADPIRAIYFQDDQKELLHALQWGHDKANSTNIASKMEEVVTEWRVCYGIE